MLCSRYLHYYFSHPLPGCQWQNERTRCVSGTKTDSTTPSESVVWMEPATVTSASTTRQPDQFLTETHARFSNHTVGCSIPISRWTDSLSHLHTFHHVASVDASSSPLTPPCQISYPVSPSLLHALKTIFMVRFQPATTLSSPGWYARSS